MPTYNGVQVEDIRPAYRLAEDADQTELDAPWTELAEELPADEYVEQMLRAQGEAHPEFFAGGIDPAMPYDEAVAHLDALVEDGVAERYDSPRGATDAAYVRTDDGTGDAPHPDELDEMETDALVRAVLDWKGSVTPEYFESQHDVPLGDAIDALEAYREEDDAVQREQKPMDTGI